MSSFLSAEGQGQARWIVRSSALTGTVDIVSTLLLRTVTNGGLHVDNGRGVGRLLGLRNGRLDRIVVARRQ